MLSKDQIIERLRQNHHHMADGIKTLSEQDFSAALPGKWTAGQQLDHIYRAVKPLTMALGLPKIAVRLLIGKANRPSRDYDGIVEKYHAALVKGGKASGKYVPRPVAFQDRPALAAKLRANVEKLISNLGKYSEQDLDTLLLPHPLLGKMTVREMLYFTIYHCEHHHKMAMVNL